MAIGRQRVEGVRNDMHRLDRAVALEALLKPDELAVMANAERLSHQERAVFVLLGQGHATKSAAFELALSIKTVDTVIARIRGKLSIDRPLAFHDLVFLARMWVRADDLWGRTRQDS